MIQSLKEAHPKRPEEIDPVTYPDSLVLIDPVTGRLAKLDALSALIWLYADGSRTCGDITAEIGKVLEDIMPSKVEEVVRTLVENRFLTLDT